MILLSPSTGEKMVGIYIRVSTVEQETGESPETQKDAGLAFVESVKEPYAIYTDSASSKVGAKARKGYEALKKDIEAKKILTVAFWSVSRLGRDPVEGFLFIRFLITHGTRLYDTEQKRYINLNDPHEVVFIEIGFVFSGHETRLKTVNVAENLHHLFDRGERRVGKLFGYYAQARIEQVIVKGRRVEKTRRTWHINEDEAILIRRIFDLALKGNKGLSEICRQINNEGYRTRGRKYWTHDRIRNILTQPIYAGRTTDSKGNEIKSAVYPAIVSYEEYKEMRKRYPEYISSRKKGRPNEHIGSGILECAYCGSRYSFHEGWGVYKKKDGEEIRYPKLTYHHNVRATCEGQTYYNQEIIDKILGFAYDSGLEMVDGIIARLNVKMGTKEFTEVKNRYEERKAEIEKEIANLNKAIARAGTDDAIDAIMPDIRSRTEELTDIRKEITKVDAEIEKRTTGLRGSINALQRAQRGEWLRTKTDKERNGLVRTIIQRVIVDKNVIRCVYIDGSEYLSNYGYWLPRKNKGLQQSLEEYKARQDEKRQFYEEGNKGFKSYAGMWAGSRTPDMAVPDILDGNEDMGQWIINVANDTWVSEYYKE